MRQLFYYKTSHFLLQNGTDFLQNATVIRQCDDSITKSDVCYKMHQYSGENLSVV